jgi:hypothetical protein
VKAKSCLGHCVDAAGCQVARALMCDCDMRHAQSKLTPGLAGRC